MENSVKEFSNPFYNLKDPRFPSAICGTCRIALKKERNDGCNKYSLPQMPNFEDIILPIKTRFTKQCFCYICQTARQNKHVKFVKGKGIVIPSIQISNVESATSNVSTLSSFPTFTPETSRMELCKKCFTEIGRGKRHSCSINKASGNIIKTMVDLLPDAQQEQLITTMLHKKSLFKPNTELSLSSKGNKTKVIINPKPQVEKVKFSEESLAAYQSKTGVSSYHMKGLTNYLRSTAGRKSVPSHYKEHINMKKKEFEDIYNHDILDFDIDGGKMEKRPVVWANTAKLLDEVLDRRDLHDNFQVKVMADGGQGFFKISMSIIPESYYCGSMNEDVIEENIKRSKYCEGGSIGKPARLTSVKKVIMLCIVPDIKETYENVKILFELTNINEISFKFISDLKLCLIVNGQQTASASYPSPYCSVTLTEMRSDNNDIDVGNDDDNDDYDNGDNNVNGRFGKNICFKLIFVIYINSLCFEL